MLTVAYCRVSTEEQAEEGFSVDGQANRLRSYAELHELGAVTVIEDPGWSGKNMDRPGLQQLLAMVEAGHVANVLIWRLDRLSRDLGDLILLADTFGQAGVALHSFTEKLDLSSATGRMFYNILGSFAQFYREQLSENVRMGMHQAVKQGRWINRPPTGYDLRDGVLVANDDAPKVCEVYRLRAEGHSQREVSERTGIKQSTVLSILRSRAYLGETLLNGEWFPGLHEPLVSEAEWEAAHRGQVPGRRRGSDPLSGKVFCGMCLRRMAIEVNGVGRTMYRCHHRGQGCDQPRRTNLGLHRAAVLGLRLVTESEKLQEAIRRKLAGDRSAGEGASSRRRRSRRTPADDLAALSEKRRKLLDLFYAGKITEDGFGEAEAQLAGQIEAVRSAADRKRSAEGEVDELVQRFEAVVAALREIDLDGLWEAADDAERRVLVDELVQGVTVFRDHLEVNVAGLPAINVTLEEVGLKSQIGGVGGGT